MSVSIKYVLNLLGRWVPRAFCAAILIVLTACEQEYIDPDQLFIKLYGSSRQERGIDFIRTEDGFVILMQTNSPSLMRALPSVTELNELKGEGLLREDTEVDNAADLLEYGSNEVDYLVVFTDHAGNEIDRKSFGNIRGDTIVNNVLANSEDIPSAIYRTKDGGYIIVGTSTYTIKETRANEEGLTARQSDVFIVKLNSSRELAFQNIYGDRFYSDPEEGTTILVHESGADVLETEDGYIIFGTTSRVNKRKYNLGDGVSPDDKTDFYLVKVSLDGSAMIWENILGFPDAEQAVSILLNEDECSNCSIIMGQTTQFAQAPVRGAGGTNVVFARLDGSGSVQGAGYFGFDGDEYPKRMRRISPNEFYIVGTYKESGRKDKAFLFEVTINARLRLPPTYGFDVNPIPPSLGPREGSQLEEDVEGSDALKIPGQGYFVVGTLKQYNSSAGSKGSEMIIMRTDISGSIDPNFGNESIYGINYGGFEDDSFSRILRLSSGELLLLGTLSFGGISTMACLMKTNAEGRLEQMP